MSGAVRTPWGKQANEKEKEKLWNPPHCFSKTPPLKLFAIAALPGSVSMLASALYQLLDGAFVGRLLGETAFAALNLAMPFVIINFSLADLIGVGSSVHISVCLGRKKRARSLQHFHLRLPDDCRRRRADRRHIVRAALLIGFMGPRDFAAMAIQQIMRVYALCSPVTTIIFAVDNYLRICGYVRGMWLNSSNVCSVRHSGIFPRRIPLGHLGGGAGDLLRNDALRRHRLSPLSPQKAMLRFCRPQFRIKMIRQIIACGSPNFLNNIAGRITSILINRILVRLGGETAVSVYGVLMYVDGFVQPIMYGLCDSLQPAVGYNWAPGAIPEFGPSKNAASRPAASFPPAGGHRHHAFSRAQITKLFVNDITPENLKLFVDALRLFCLTYIVRWFSFATQSYMLAIEKPMPASLISVSTALAFPVLLIAALWPLGLTGIWLNFAGTAFLAAVLSLFVLLKLRRELTRPDAFPTEDAG